MESKEQKRTNKTNSDTETQIQRTNRCLPSGRGAGELGEKVKGLSSTDWQLHSSHRDVKYSTENAVNSTLITMYGFRWAPNLSGESLRKLHK